MNFNKTTEYALRIFGYIAADESKLYTSDEIYKNLHIPFRYLRKLLTSLSKSGLIITIKGKNGGFRLARKSNELSLLDIVKATKEPQLDNKCFFGFKDCAFESKCAMHDKWEAVRGSIKSVLSTTTLADITDTETQEFIRDNSLLILKKD